MHGCNILEDRATIPAINDKSLASLRLIFFTPIWEGDAGTGDASVNCKLHFSLIISLIIFSKLYF